MTDVIQSNCEYCGRAYYIDPGQLAVMHDIPTCPTFDAMEPMPFIVANRKIKENRRDNKADN